MMNEENFDKLDKPLDNKIFKGQTLSKFKNFNIEIMRINDIILPALKVNYNTIKNKKTIAHVTLKIKELIGIENTFNNIPLNLIYNEIIDFAKNYPEKCIIENVTFSTTELS